MILAFLSDTHLLWNKPVARLDDAKWAVLQKLEYVLNYLKGKILKNTSGALIISGDVTDIERSWYLLPEIIKLLSKYDLPIFAVYGSHDMYLYSRKSKSNTLLGVLESCGLITILEDVPYPVLEVNLYGSHYGKDISIPKVITKGMNILVIHAPISIQKYSGGRDYIDAKEFLREHKEFNIIHCGHIHRKFFYKEQGRAIFNTGPLLRKTAEKYNFEHRPCFYLFDTASRVYETIDVPCKAARSVLTRERIEKKQNKEEILGEFIDSIQELRMEKQKDEGKEENLVDEMYKAMKKKRIDKGIIDILSEVISDRK